MGYMIPDPIVDEKEKQLLQKLSEDYNKMVEPSTLAIVAREINDIIPEKVKIFWDAAKGTLTDKELIKKSIEILGTSFHELEKIAASVTISNQQVLKQIGSITTENRPANIDEICLVRSYEIACAVGKYNRIDKISTLFEGATTGAFGFAGLPFNLALSLFLFYRAVQSIALFYGYDGKQDPAELEIAGEVLVNAMNPQESANSEITSAIAKVMLISETTTIKETVKKGWAAMAQKDAATLLVAQLRALANTAAKQALDKAGKAGFENSAFRGVLEQIGKRLTKNAVGKSMPVVGAFVGATLDTAQMNQILRYANIFYQKRFILEKEQRIADCMSKCKLGTF